MNKPNKTNLTENRSLVNGQSFGIGKFELLTLKELRARVSAVQSEVDR